MRMNTKPLLLATALTTLVVAPALAADPTPKAAGPTSYEQRDAAALKRNIEVAERAKPDPKLKTSHYRPVLTVERQLSKNEVKVRAMIDAIVDGAVIYHIGDTPKARRQLVQKRQQKHAILTSGATALAIGKVGDVVTLHLRRDAKGVAFVTNITR